jgi:hypothetical protein
MSVSWRKLAATALQNTQISRWEWATIANYRQDGPWIQFISAGVDTGASLPKSAQISGPIDQRMAKALLLPDEEEVGGIVEEQNVKQRVTKWLRKNGFGRRLCVTKRGYDKGSVALVLAESERGDEIWAFRGTTFPYVLRKLEGGMYVVVGEAREYSVSTLTKREYMIDFEIRFR